MTIVHYGQRHAVIPSDNTAKFVSAFDEAEIIKISSSVKLLISVFFLEKTPKVLDVAGALGLSVRSLQRKLSSAGLTYSELLDRVRLEIAVELLQRTADKIIDIAFAAGYSDPAHFSRAFRRMAGTTPRNFRCRSRHR
ncbi:helix-turn-helix transcriptional regulator [Bosea sp. BK604]|uniref:helix-turn-helix transcriptional regulator n=1 Tax=Bosea sp. BK604 TaxID=2512180 RepID=UPI00105084C3|nr:helix-turn-helix transcriptional regulator [Bosea sp. BK604]